MAKQNYDVLEDQIGAMGEETPQSMGKLKHKESYGGKTDLTDKEQADMDAFLTRSKKHREETKSDILVSDGWIPIDRNEMGFRSNYYDNTWEFYIRPATVQAIKNWTAIDEERPDVLNNIFNEIIKTCVKINSPKGVISWNQIKSWDRFWFILKVREYTYAQGQQKIEFADDCSECGEEIEYTLTSKGLFYEFPDEDLVEKYWDVDNSVWKIDPREYDVDHDIIVLYTPTIERDQAIIDWATAKVRAGGKYDETFINFLIWLMPKPAKDLQVLDRQISQIYKEYKKWSLDMFTFMSDVIRNITINQSEKLKAKCPSCGREATSTVQFPNGIKVLFEVKTGAKKFGSR